jgi:D-3-phosphoglycerate dehydrogenase
MRKKVLITETLDPVCAQGLGERHEVVWCSIDKGQELDARLAEADALVVRTYTQVNDQLLDKAPNVKAVGRAGVGLDNIDLEACRKRGVPVVSTPDANTQAVVEYVLGLMLDHYRPRTNLPANADAAAFHKLRKTQVGKQLDELTVGILGFGRIGKRLAKACWALGIRVIACDILPHDQLKACIDYPVELVNFDTLFATSDVLSIHVDGRPENRRLVAASALKKLKPNALVINAARGMLVDTQALADWAKANPNGGVILDVHEPEPPPTDYPAFNVPNIRVLPHLASRTDRALENMSWVVKDIDRILKGEKPQFPAW